MSQDVEENRPWILRIQEANPDPRPLHYQMLRIPVEHTCTVLSQTVHARIQHPARAQYQPPETIQSHQQRRQRTSAATLLIQFLLRSQRPRSSNRSTASFHKLLHSLNSLPRSGNQVKEPLRHHLGHHLGNHQHCLRPGQPCSQGPTLSMLGMG